MKTVPQILDAMRTLGVTTDSLLERLRMEIVMRDLSAARRQLAFVDELLAASDPNRPNLNNCQQCGEFRGHGHECRNSTKIPTECGRYEWEGALVTVYWNNGELMVNDGCECEEVSEYDAMLRDEGNIEDKPWVKVGNCCWDECDGDCHKPKCIECGGCGFLEDFASMNIKGQCPACDGSGVERKKSETP